MSSTRMTSKRQQLKNFFKSNPLTSSSRAGPHESESSERSHQAHLSQNLKISAKFMLLILPKLARCVDENPAKMAFNILSVIMDLKKEINDNKDELQRVLEETLMLLSTVLTTVETRSNAHSVVDQMVAQYKREITQQLERITTLNERLTSTLVSQFDYQNYKRQLMDISRIIAGSTSRFNTGMTANTGIMVDELYDGKREEKLRKDLNPSKIADHRFIHDGKSALKRRTCTEGTRVTILKEIAAWANDSAAASPTVFWLTGQAGAGKTTIAYTIAKRFGDGQPTTLGASFFCSRQFAETQSLQRIVPTIAFQLARQCEPYRIALFGVDTSDAVDSHNVNEQIQKFLFKPWLARARGHGLPNYLIIVDALDEIENTNRSSFLKALLESIERESITGLKFLVTSRADPAIAKLYRSFPLGAICQLQNVPVEEAKQDVVTYLNVELTDLNGTPELDELNEKAAGLFIYAATVVKILAKNELDKDEQLLLLRSSLSSIDQLYQQIMRDAFEDLDDDLLWNRLRILCTFLCSAERISASVASSLVNTKVGIASKVLDSLHAVLYVEDGRVYWYHASFPDFIFSRARSNFRMDDKEFTFSCDAAAQHSLLAHACFRIMNSKDTGLRFNMGDIKSSYLLDHEHAEELLKNVNKNISPTLRYACMHWAHHVSLSPPTTDNPIYHVITDFFQLRVLFWIEAMHLLGSSGQCWHLLHNARNRASKDGNLNLAKDLKTVADFATYFTSCSSADSTPHLYISSLATWQSTSRFSRTWRDTFPYIPAYKHTGGIVAMPIMTMQLHVGVKAITFSPDGKYALAGLWEFALVLDTSTGREKHVLPVEDSRYVEQVKFSSDGTRFVTVSTAERDYYMVHIWDVSTFERLHEFTADRAAVSIEGTEILTLSEAAPNDHRQLQVLDISTGTLLRTEEIMMPNSVELMGFSSVSMRFMITVRQSVQIWDISPECAAEKVTLNDCVVNKAPEECGTMSPGGSLVAMVTSEDGFEAGVFDASTGSRLFVLPHDQAVEALAFSYDGTHIGSVSYHGTLYIWDAATGAKLKFLKTNSINSCTSVAFTRDGLHIGLGLGSAFCMWSLDDLAEVECGTLNDSVSDVILTGLGYVRVSDNSKKIMSFNETKVQVWDATTGTTLMSMSAPLRIDEAQMSGNGENIVCRLKDSVKVLNTSNGAEILHLEGEFDMEIRSIAISQSGTKLALNKYTDWGQARVEIWGLNTGKEAEFVVNQSSYYSSLNFLDDERFIVAAFDGCPMVIYDLQTSDTEEIESKIDQYYRLLSTNGNELAVCERFPHGDSEWCEIWDISSGKLQNTFKLSLWPQNHDGEDIVQIVSLVFSSKGKKFVAACDTAGYIRVWSTVSNTTIVDVMLVYCSPYLWSIALSRDNELAVIGSEDGSVQVWDLDDNPDMAEKYPWALTKSGWIISSQNRNHRLIWVSDRLKVRQPRSTLFVSGPGYGSVDFSGAMIGEEWEKCYSPRNSIGKNI